MLLLRLTLLVLIVLVATAVVVLVVVAAQVNPHGSSYHIIATALIGPSNRRQPFGSFSSPGHLEVLRRRIDIPLVDIWILALGTLVEVPQ